MKPLTQREEAIRQYLDDGSSYRKIATKLQVSRDTVKSWVRRYRVSNDLTANSIKGKINYTTIPKDRILQSNYEKRIKQLEMEVELLRDFLCEEERRSIKK